MRLCLYLYKQKENIFMDTSTLLWDANTSELANGYKLIKKEYTCLICGMTYCTEEVYPVDNHFYTAEKMIQKHIEKEHGSMFDYMVHMNKSYTSLSENQKEVLVLMYKGASDAKIAKELSLSESTIRNYRFKFREKEKQAKIFLAIINSINNQTAISSGSQKDTNPLIEPHLGARQIDERYQITEKDIKQTLKSYMDEHGALNTFPAKEKKKIIILREIAKNFKQGEVYSEKEINRILKRIYDDYVLIRRYLIQYGFLDRNTDGTGYWVK